ncbi:MAG TPA: hypothetical protein VGR51_10050 [Thermoplasmata archaeon]|nr:hypothetical protein [Thermoplasmata archaeon]
MVLAFALGFPPFLSYNVKKQIRWLRPMTPEIREAGWPLTRGITLVLRDGIVLLLPAFSVICVMFFGPDRAVLQPSLSDVIRWTSVRSAVLSSRRLGIARGRAPGPLDAELKALQDRMGATLSACAIREAKAHVADPANPQWMVIATFASPFAFGRLRADLVAAELTAIEALLRRTLESLAPTGGIVPTA